MHFTLVMYCKTVQVQTRVLQTSFTESLHMWW